MAGFAIVGERQEDTAPAAPTQEDHDHAQRLILLAIKTLSQRATVAIAHLFTILMCGSAFWLWMVTLPNPTTYQLIGLGLYGALIIALHLVKRRE